VSRVKGDLPVYNEAVPVQFTRALVGLARAHQQDLQAMQRAARLPFDPLRDEALTALLSPEQYSRLCLQVFRELADEAGGIMSDARTPPGTLRLIALSMINSSQLVTAMRRGIEFNACCRVREAGRVVNDLQVNNGGREAVLTYLCCDDPADRQHSVLCALAMWVRFCGWLIGQHIDITSATCAGPEPGFRQGILHFLPCPVSFDQGVNSVTFSARHLDAEVIRGEHELDDFLKLAPYHIVIEPPASVDSTAHRIRQFIGEDFRQELPSFEALTRFLNMSARTLRRRLEKEGTSYQRIKDNARRDAAISLLSQRGLTVSDVAEMVGFSDPSAFHRSFKKWTGRSPGSCR